VTDQPGSEGRRVVAVHVGISRKGWELMSRFVSNVPRIQAHHSAGRWVVYLQSSNWAPPALTLVNLEGEATQPLEFTVVAFDEKGNNKIDRMQEVSRSSFPLPVVVRTPRRQPLETES
jgi:hypothetical protein